MPSILALILAIALWCPNARAAAGKITEQFSPEKGELEWRFDGRKVAVVTFATNKFKPYVQELYTLRGDNVLRDSPPDHLHHHGLMYAVRLNALNFWEEKIDPGDPVRPAMEKTIRVLRHRVTKKNGIPQASCTWLIHWVAPTNAASTSEKDALLIEQRTLTLSIDEKTEEVAVQWTGEFKVGNAVPTVKFHGTDYNGLGMRLPQSFDHIAKYQNSENAPYPGTAKEPTRNVVSGKWTCVSGKIEQRPITVAIFGATGNRNGNHFFTLLDRFAYMGVTQALNEQPFELSPGDKYDLNYLVTVYPGDREPAFLNQRYELWQKTVRHK